AAVRSVELGAGAGAAVGFDVARENALEQSSFQRAFRPVQTRRALIDDQVAERQVAGRVAQEGMLRERVDEVGGVLSQTLFGEAVTERVLQVALDAKRQIAAGHVARTA